MNLTKALLLVGTALATLATPPAQGITIEFSGNSSTSGSAGNVRTFSSEGVTVTVSAETRHGSDWQSSYLGIYPSGLGVTNSTEGSGAGEAHSTGDSSGLDRVVFDFSTAVILHAICLDAYWDTDMTLWRFAAGVWTAVENNFGGWSDRLAMVNASGLSSTRWGVSALHTTDSNSDSFKIAHIEFSKATTGQHNPPPPTNGVPDSGNSLLLLVMSMGSLVFLRGKAPLLG